MFIRNRGYVLVVIFFVILGEVYIGICIYENMLYEVYMLLVIDGIIF